MKLTKVLITGSEGLIGKPTTELLQQSGYEVHPFDIAHNTEHDIRDYNSVLKATEGMDAVVHLAAIPHPHAEFAYRDYFDCNVLGAFNVAEACAANKVKRLIYSSSTAYYGIAWKVPDVKAPIGPESTLNYAQVVRPNKVIGWCWLYYGSSKVATESLLAAYGDTQRFEVVMLRFSPCMADKKAIPGVVKRYGTYVAVEDAARSIKLALDCEQELWYEPFNISTVGTDTSKAERILGY